MSDYYSKKLAGERLKQCYDVASPRVRQYLDAEIAYVKSRLKATDEVLELGCGYGRVTLDIAGSVKRMVGVDIAEESIDLAQRNDPGHRCEYQVMDAVDLQFPENSFDAIICVQNGICAFGVDQVRLLEEALRVVRDKGLLLFSTYSDQFWADRLHWFEAQAAAGLMGSVDRSRCGEGVIVCEDGFCAGRMKPEDFAAICSSVSVKPEITEIDDSCLFCEIVKR